MKLFDALRAKCDGRVLPPMRTISAECRGNPPDHIFSDEHWTWKVSATFSCVMSGPEDSRAEIMRRARRVIAREVFGEIEAELRELLEILWTEGYRPSGDPALDKIETMIKKVRGDG